MNPQTSAAVLAVAAVVIAIVLVWAAISDSVTL
jgi:hypothetical protein